MGGSDGNAQQRATYSLDRRSPKYWWPLFTFLHDAACLNAYILYQSCDREDHEDHENEGPKTLSREKFIRNIAMNLITEPAGNGRKRKSAVDNVALDEPDFSPEHQWMRLPKRRRCDRCKANKSRPSVPQRSRKRKALAEIDGNVADGNERARKDRKLRGSQTSWGCSAFGCKKKAACKNAECWKYIHMRVHSDDV